MTQPVILFFSIKNAWCSEEIVKIFQLFLQIQAELDG